MGEQVPGRGAGGEGGGARGEGARGEAREARCSGLNIVATLPTLPLLVATCVTQRQLQRPGTANG